MELLGGQGNLDFQKLTGAADSAVAPFALTVIGTWWLCRGIELSAAVVGDLTVDLDKAVAEFSLPVSKNDPDAKGTVRSHGCICESNRKMARLCPFHLAVSHLAGLRTWYKPTVAGKVLVSPLFPSWCGRALTKSATIAAIRATLKGAAIPLTRQLPSGLVVQRFAEHCLRVSGAQFLAAAGLDTYKVQLLARHSSSAVFRYIQQSPLQRQHLFAAEAVAALDDVGVPSQMNHNFSEVLARVQALEQAQAKPTVVLNDTSEVVHRLRDWDLQVSSSAWSTVCGWKFAAKSHTLLLAALPGMQTCSACFCGTRSLPRRAASVSSSVTSSATSSSGSASG